MTAVLVSFSCYIESSPTMAKTKPSDLLTPLEARSPRWAPGGGSQGVSSAAVLLKAPGTILPSSFPLTFPRCNPDLEFCDYHSLFLFFKKLVLKLTLSLNFTKNIIMLSFL